jgi:hypothetical protein
MQRSSHSSSSHERIATKPLWQVRSLDHFSTTVVTQEFSDRVKYIENIAALTLLNYTLFDERADVAEVVLFLPSPGALRAAILVCGHQVMSL